MYFGISPKIQSCRFILPFRKNMITHSFTVKFLYFLLLMKNKSRSKFRSREKVGLNFLFVLCIYIFFNEKALKFILPKECLYIKTFNSVRAS